MDGKTVIISIFINLFTEALALGFVIFYLERKDRRLKEDIIFDIAGKVLERMYYNLRYYSYIPFVAKRRIEGYVPETEGVIGGIRKVVSELVDSTKSEGKTVNSARR